MLSEYQPTDVLIVAALRSPVGKFRGGLAKLEAHEIGGQVLRALINRATGQEAPSVPKCASTPEELEKPVPAALDPVAKALATSLDCVILGQVFTAGCGQNPARQAATLAGIPFAVPSWGVNMLCGSGLLSVGLASDRLRGHSGFSIAGGQESMTRARQLLERPLAKTAEEGAAKTPLDSMLKDGLTDAFSGLHMGHTAENIALKYKLSRDEQDAFAIASQRKYQAALAEGKFQAEIVEIAVDEEAKISLDEHPRPMGPDASLANLKAAFARDGFTNSVTAGNASGINDGAAMLFLARRDALGDFLKSDNPEICRIVGWRQTGCQPETMGLGPVCAVQSLLKAIGWTLESVDRFELNEAFAAQSLAVMHDLGADPARVNVCGGSIAIGHPLGCSGARVLVTLVHEMSRLRREKNQPVRGIAALCVGGGMGIAMAVEKL